MAETVYTKAEIDVIVANLSQVRDRDRQYQSKVDSAIHGRLHALDGFQVTGQTPTGWVNPEAWNSSEWSNAIVNAAVKSRRRPGHAGVSLDLEGPDGWHYHVVVQA